MCLIVSKIGFNLPVVMRRPNMHEGRVVSEREHAKSQAVQDVYHARNSGELSKGDHPLALNVAHPLKHEEYRDVKKGWEILLSRTQAESGRTGKQEQEQISPNHVPTIFHFSVCVCLSLQGL